MAFSEEQWLQRYAAELGVPVPTPQERESLLAMAGVAAHTSERTAAPISCWMAALARITPQEAERVARDLAASMQEGFGQSDEELLS